MKQEKIEKAVSIQEGQEVTFKCDALKTLQLTKG